jgi:hypothetical protein
MTDIATIAQHCGGGAGAKKLLAIGANVAQIGKGISSIIKAKAAISAGGGLTASAAFSVVTAGLSIVAGVVSIAFALFSDDDEADQLAAALADVHADLHALRHELREDLHEVGRVLQSDIHTLGQMVSQVMANEEIIYKEVHALLEGIHDVKTLLGDYIHTSNAYLKCIAQADLRKACFHVEQYLSKTAIPFGNKVISNSLREIEFWLSSELQTPVINDVVFAQISSERVIGMLHHYKTNPTSMPGFFAARLRHHFGDIVDVKYTQLPPLELYLTIVNHFVLGHKAAQLPSSDGHEASCNRIRDTINTTLSFIELLKNNTALWQRLFETYNGYRHQLGRIVAEAKKTQSKELIRDMANSPLNAPFRQVILAMEEQRLLLSMLADYVDGNTPGELTHRVLALDSMEQIVQQPQRLLSPRSGFLDSEALEIKNRPTVVLPPDTEHQTISYEHKLREWLAQFEQDAAELKAMCPALTMPTQSEPRPLGNGSPPANTHASVASGGTMPEAEKTVLPAESEDPVERKLYERTRLFYREHGIDETKAPLWRKSSRSEDNPRTRLMPTAHFNAQQRGEFFIQLNRQDAAYHAAAVRVGDEKCVQVQLPEQRMG